MWKLEPGGVSIFHKGLLIEQFISYLGITCLRVRVSWSRTAIVTIAEHAHRSESDEAS